MKWVFALMLFFSGSYSAECGDFAPFHTDKTWHYQIRIYSGIPSIYVIDSLEAYWKILSIDANAEIRTIHTSITVLGTTRTYTVSNGETTMVERLHEDWDLREDYIDSAGDVRGPYPGVLGFHPFSYMHYTDCTPIKNSLAQDVFYDSSIGGSRVTVYHLWNNSMHFPQYDEFATGIGLIKSSGGGLVVRSNIRFQAFETAPSAAIFPRGARLPRRGLVKQSGISESFTRRVFKGHFADGRAVSLPQKRRASKN